MCIDRRPPWMYAIRNSKSEVDDDVETASRQDTASAEMMMVHNDAGNDDQDEDEEEDAEECCDGGDSGMENDAVACSGTHMMLIMCLKLPIQAKSVVTAARLTCCHASMHPLLLLLLFTR